jgi:hypothetical protein
MSPTLEPKIPIPKDQAAKQCVNKCKNDQSKFILKVQSIYKKKSIYMEKNVPQENDF